MSFHHSEARMGLHYSVFLHVNVAGQLFQAGHIYVCVFSHLMFSAVTNCEFAMVFQCKVGSVLL